MTLHLRFMGCHLPCKITVLPATKHKFQWPSYLYQLVQQYTPSRKLRSSNQNLLAVNRIRTAFAQRSFGHTAATVWNSLPINCRNCIELTVETFRKHLETHLFETTFITA